MTKFLTPILFFQLLCAGFGAQAQTTAPETADVKKTITAFFDGMRQGDSTAVRRTLAPGAVFHTIVAKAGVTEVKPESLLDFLKAVGTPHPKVWDERISFASVLIDANLASVWTPYEFYLGGTFSHCGYNSFQLVKLADGWKIAHVIDTRRKEKCR
ncbi:nuclear transport factor 2 family protein [Hymenobacter sp. IS2118]|uniref:nuclear transport factor 2 family protein n=1 Tax=Hymenobacter sp. IS2118 TaxID=1505605 RepID=UPI0005571A35|nr:nuclear transport factor 2 family protein [Hymenobacter sp. IS2118]